ncbi:MAG: RecX family transcriptional regulator [Gemmatimonadetes bacterium]|nr:RecX family transcriptional regulator [Gemmatimonadota bacterium]
MTSTVTGLRPEEGRAAAAARVRVEVDGAPLAMVSVHGLKRLAISEGAEVDRETLAARIEQAEIEATLERALQLLSYRSRTREELRRRLAADAYPEPALGAVLCRLEETGLVDDRAYCAAFIRGRLAARPEGIRRMAEALYRRGIDREPALAAIRRVLEEEGMSEREVLERAAEKKLRALARKPRQVARRRLFDHLARRGFPLDEIRALVDQKLPGTG